MLGPVAIQSCWSELLHPHMAGPSHSHTHLGVPLGAAPWGSKDQVPGSFRNLLEHPASQLSRHPPSSGLGQGGGCLWTSAVCHCPFQGLRRQNSALLEPSSALCGYERGDSPFGSSQPPYHQLTCLFDDWACHYRSFKPYTQDLSTFLTPEFRTSFDFEGQRHSFWAAGPVGSDGCYTVTLHQLLTSQPLLIPG